MWKCHVCGNNSSPTLKELLKHLCFHKRGKDLSTWCPVTGCHLRFKKYDTLYRHIRIHHRQELEGNVIVELDSDNSVDSDEDDVSDVCDISEVCDISDVCDISGPSNISQEDLLLNASTRFFHVVKSSKISQVDVNNIIEGANDLVNSTIGAVSDAIDSNLQVGVIGSVDSLKERVESLTSPLAGLHSKYMQDQWIRDKLPHVKPVELVLGHRMV